MSRWAYPFTGGDFKKWALAFVVALLATPVARAGPIFFPGSMNEGAFVSDKQASVNYTIKFSDVSATINGGWGKLRIRETIVGPEQGVRTVCLIPLPKGVSGEGVSLSLDRGSAQREIDTVCFLNAAAAQKLYESIAKQSGFVEIVAHAMFQHGHIDHTVAACDADRIAEIAQRSRRITASAHTGNSGHTRVVPATHKALFHQAPQFAFAGYRVIEVKPRKFDLLRMHVGFQLIKKPVVQGPVIFKL